MRGIYCIERIVDVHVGQISVTREVRKTVKVRKIPKHRHDQRRAGCETKSTDRQGCQENGGGSTGAVS